NVASVRRVRVAGRASAAFPRRSFWGALAPPDSRAAGTILPNRSGESGAANYSGRVTGSVKGLNDCSRERKILKRRARGERLRSPPEKSSPRHQKNIWYTT